MNTAAGLRGASSRIVLPFVEEIYDCEDARLRQMLTQLRADLKGGREDSACLPAGIETVQKLERKIAKLIECIELELEERSAVENVIGFFTGDSSATTAAAALSSDDPDYFNAFLKDKSYHNNSALQQEQPALARQWEPLSLSDSLKNNMVVPPGQTQAQQPALPLRVEKDDVDDEIDPQRVMEDVESNFTTQIVHH